MSGVRVFVTAIAIMSTVAAAGEPVLLKPSPVTWPEDGGVGGEVELLLSIDATGKVTGVDVQSSPGEAFSAAATSAAKALVFEPMTQDGGAVGMVIEYRYQFEPPVLNPDAGLLSARLAGRVATRGTRDSIALAQVTVNDGGVETDGDGHFSLCSASGC